MRLKEWTGDENFGINPRFGGFGISADKDVFEIATERIENKMAKLKILMEEKDKRIAELEKRCENLSRDNYRTYGNKVLSFVERIEEL